MPRLIVALAALVLISGFAPAQAELLVSVSKLQQRVVVSVDGTEAYRWPVSTGVRGHDTPAGVFRPIRLERHWYSRQYDLTPMPWAMFFHRGYAMHGTMEAYNLGRAASHGCVRLRPDNAATLYSLIRHQGLGNTKIVVMNGALPVPSDAKSLADAHTPPDAVAETFAAASGEDTRDYSAKRHGETRGETHGETLGEVETPRAREAQREVKSYRVSAGSDEARILRERQAWLRALDRKYGFAQ